MFNLKIICFKKVEGYELRSGPKKIWLFSQFDLKLAP